MRKALAEIKDVENIIVHRIAMRRLSECGLTINFEKSVFNMSKLVFMGMLLSEEGIGPIEARVHAILDACAPTSQSEVHSFLGLAHYSSWFIPWFATITEPLQRLLQKATEFKFRTEQKSAFNKLKLKITEAGTLAYSDKVIADASPA